MESEQEENLPLELTESMTEKFLHAIGMEGIAGKSAAVAIAVDPGFFSLPPELNGLLGALGVAYAGISSFIGCRNLKRFIVEYFGRRLPRYWIKTTKNKWSWCRLR
ncbi:MAG: hypothetical protein IJ741_03785 [Schwartzia sp.]|nr:hypothetical protein [Schwartzia sp. (in: firmicutes)]